MAIKLICSRPSSLPEVRTLSATTDQDALLEIAALKQTYFHPLRLHCAYNPASKELYGFDPSTFTIQKSTDIFHYSFPYDIVTGDEIPNPTRYNVPATTTRGSIKYFVIGERIKAETGNRYDLPERSTVFPIAIDEVDPLRAVTNTLTDVAASGISDYIPRLVIDTGSQLPYRIGKEDGQWVLIDTAHLQFGDLTELNDMRGIHHLAQTLEEALATSVDPIVISQGPQGQTPPDPQPL